MKPALVVTSISAPNGVLRALAEGAGPAGFDFTVIGDSKSPADFELDGCDFYSVDRQRETGLRFAELCPTRHYARKNIGYLLAIKAGAPLILETDDDNYPRDGFWTERQRNVHAPALEKGGWVNVYRYFSDAPIWPRGLPLDEIQTAPPAFESLETATTACPIQQGLADENPDVDAIYRLAFPLPQNFRTDRRVALGPGSWCPFNSQNTAWWPEAYPLLYLPAHCSFRMTDIWRSFVAQRIAWANGWSVLFHEPNVWQERNEHSLMRDFADEVPGYLNNRAICAELDSLELEPGAAAMGDNLRRCYEMLTARGWVGTEELQLLDAWLADLASIANA
jgi:hypothetical protein